MTEPIKIDQSNATVQDSINPIDEQGDNSNEDWMRLQKDWQNFEPDLNKINRKISWVTWRMISILVLDAIIILAYIPFLVLWVMPSETSLLYKLWPYLMLPLGVYGTYLDFKLRMPLFRLEKGSSKEILNAYLKFVQAGVLVGLWGFRFLLMMLVLFIVWASAIHLFDSESARSLPINLVISVAVAIALTSAVMYWYKNKKARESRNLLDLWREYIE